MPARRPLIWLAMAVAALAQGNPAPAAPAEPPMKHFRVMWMHEPAQKAMVSWTTPVPGQSHAVHYDVQSRAGRLADYAHRTTALPAIKFTMEPTDEGTPEGWAQHVLLQDLKPSTAYYFVMASDGRVSREYHFITAPDDDRPIKLLFGGDSRRPPALPEPHLDRRAVNRLIAGMVEEDPDILAFAHGGDYCSRAEWRFMSDWLSDHELTITRTGRILPIIPARGNHDRHVGFEEIFFWHGRTHDYHYTTALSRQVALVTLNTEISRTGNQRDWLEAELASLRKDAGKWILASYHIPAYGSVKALEQGAPQRQHWVPLFEQFGVNLVLESDHHMLKRTVPIYQDKHDPERGIVYIGDGGLGVPQREPDLTRWYLKSPGFARPTHHIHVLEFGPQEIRVRAFDLDRQVLDDFVVKPNAVPAGR
jgi:hypothetical protein